MSESFDVTERNRVVRVPSRGHYDRETVYQILDDANVIHIGINHGGRPTVIPMFFARSGDDVLIHGATTSRLIRTLASGEEVSVTATLVDGLVLARSAFHHSMNYRSVVGYGRGRLVVDEAERDAGFRAVTEKVMPGRADDSRPPSVKELKATALIAIRLESASAKIRTGGPVDEPEDMALPHWAGVVPLRVVPLALEPDGDAPIPDYLARFMAR